jgi:hypothetical protein
MQKITNKYIFQAKNNLLGLVLTMGFQMKFIINKEDFAGVGGRNI